jgi:hypothetical protein
VTDPVGETPSQDQEDSEGDSGESESGDDTTSSEELEPEEDNGELNKGINLNPNFESEMIHKPGSKSILSVYLGQ